MDDAKFAFSETRIGITPAQIARYVLQKCGYAVGRRLMLTAARFKGAEAAALGVLDLAVDSVEALEDAERAIRSDVLGCAPGAIAACKELIVGMPQTPDDEKVIYAAENFSRCLQSDEGKEGVSSFIEKRKPRWHVEIDV
jgi:isohexenylglutaconyl-CoA hydratase